MREGLSRIRWGEYAFRGVGQIELYSIRKMSGDKRVVFISGLHGDEITPLILLSRLLTSQLNCEPTVDIIPFVNWPGIFLNERNFPFGSVNLNRSFGNSDVRTSDKILLDQLIAFVQSADLVVDLHNWDSPSAIVGISFDCSGTSIPVQALSRFGCDFIWHPDKEPDVTGSLGKALNLKGVNYCAIELPHQFLLNNKMADDLLCRLINLSQLNLAVEHIPPRGKRHNVISGKEGIFWPTVMVGDPVDKNSVIGELIDPVSLMIIEKLETDRSGIVIHQEIPRFVFEKDLVCMIGVQE